MGVLSEHKGVRLWLNAIQRLAGANLRFLFAGDGDLVSEVISARKLDQRIEFLGFVSKEQKVDVFRRANYRFCHRFGMTIRRWNI